MSLRFPWPWRLLWRVLPALWLGAALLWAPVWGQWHGIAHQLQQALATPAAAPAGDALDAGHAAGGDESHAAGSALCLVLDHWGQAGALSAWPTPAVLLSLTAAAPWVGPCAGQPERTGWRPQARAPPPGMAIQTAA